MSRGIVAVHAAQTRCSQGHPYDHVTAQGRRRCTRCMRDLVDSLHRGVDDLLRRAGVVLPPTVYVLAEDLDPPFVCSVQRRRFYRGADAAAAVRSWVSCRRRWRQPGSWWPGRNRT